MIFRVAYKKDTRVSIKVQDGDKKPVWMTCSDAVYSWCKKSFKDGDEVNVEYTENNGRFTATRVSKDGTSPAPQVEKKAEAPKQETKVEKPATGVASYSRPREYMKPKTPEESKQMRACSILSSVCQAVQSIVGHIDVNGLGDIVEALYDRFDKKLP